METFRDLRNILLRHKIKVFTEHKNLTYEKIDSASHRIQGCKRLMQEFGVTRLYIKGEANIVAYDFIWIPMVHHSHKLSDTTMEEDTCELMCMDLLLISDNTDCFSLDIENISFLYAPQIMEA